MRRLALIWAETDTSRFDHLPLLFPRGVGTMWDEIGVGFYTAWGLEDLYSIAYVFEGDLFSSLSLTQ